MTIVTIRGIRIRIHWLLVIMASVFAVCGQLTELSILFLGVIFHESCHMIVAERLGYHVSEIELLPFGGAAKIDGLSGQGWRELAIVTAGPIGSAIGGAVGYALMEDSHMMSLWVETNKMLALWNLMPAYPLDGGRLVGTLFQYAMNPKKAVRRMVRISQTIAAVLLFYVGYAWTVQGEILVSLLLMTGMIWRFALRESVRYRFVPFSIMAGKRRLLVKRGYLKTEWYTVTSERKIGEIVELFRPESYTMVRVTEESGKYCATLSETMIWQGLEKYPLTETVEKFCTRKE